MIDIHTRNLLQTSKDTFTDVPVDLRHVAPKLAGTQFPAQWITEHARHVQEQRAVAEGESGAGVEAEETEAAVAAAAGR
jgi:hypothetical protein